MVKEVQKQKSNKNKVKTEESKDNNKIGNSWVGDLTYPVRDVLIASMSNGLFLAAVMALIVVLFIYRLPSEELLVFAKNVYKGFGDLSFLGWILWLITCASWLFHVKYINRTNKKENIRLTNEKDKYQKQLFNKAIQQK